MKGHPRLTLLFAAICLVTACGVKGPPKRPEPKSPSTTTGHKAPPQGGSRLALSTAIVTTL
ncbi:MAG: lipoprotein [Candidatus Methylomirabilales bacterium]